MTRELTLVLLGAGVLTTGYLAASSPDDEVEKKAEEQAAKRTGHSTHGSHYRSGGMFIFVHSSGYAGPGTAPGKAAAPGVNRGGFGGAGRAAGAGGAS
jgi:hypothetical protein